MNDLESFTVILINFDYSSKLCFEEKSNSFIGDKIFKKKKSCQLISSDAGMVSVAKCPVMQSLQRVPKISSFELNFQRKSENQGCFKSVKKCQNITLEKWVFEKSKI